ncbi:MAG: bacterial Ig-like domain-containing protein [Paludibacteraceae bacterium]|nr:bacterial Ig-like domain-containing protein [Paludibacteraceae bacterium]
MLALGVGNAWGANYEIVAKKGSGDGSSLNTSTKVTDVFSNGTYVAKFTTATKSYYNGSNGLKLGTSNNAGDLQFTLTDEGKVKATTIIVSAKRYNTSNAVTLQVIAGGVTCTAQNISNSANFTDYTYTINANITDIQLKTSKYCWVESITINYEDGGSGEPVLSSIAISGDLTDKTYEEGDELDLTGLKVLANYKSGDPKDVTNDVEWSYEPLTAGQTSVTVIATYEDKTATQTINGLTVNEHVITPGEHCITPNNTFWGTSYTGDDAKEITNVSGKQNDVSVLMTKSGQYGYINASQTRVYENYTMLFSVPAGYAITKIVFTADGSNWKGTHTADVGKMTDTKTWVGANQNVTITFGGTCRITNICVTYIKDVKYALTITEPTEGGTLVVKDGENTLASGAEIYEGTKLTVTATPETGYEEGVVVVKNASDEDITATVYADGVLTMHAYAVTVSATFAKKPCTLLTTPVVTAAPTFNSAKLTWEVVANAAKYSVKIGSTDAVETTETSYEVTGLTAETEYTYQIQAIAEAGQDTYCDSEVAEGTFTTTAAPAATLTLKDIVGTKTLTGSLNGTITLPTEAAECSKTFVGWDADENCNQAPTYAKGAEYTFTTLDPTLYAVYADGEGGGTVTITPSKGTEETKACTFNLDQDGYTLSASGGGSNPVYNETNSDARIYAGGILTLTATKAMNTIVIKLSAQGKKRLAPITVSTGTIATQANGDATVTWTGNATEVAFTVGDKANFGSDGETKAGQLCFSTIEVTHSSEYSNYSTTCATAPIVTVTPETVTANATGAEGKVTVTYENVNTANVAVALFNDAACTEAFSADWLTTSFDGDKNITYTVAENTTYAERKAYIQLTAPETTGATDPDVVVIPVTQAAKEKVFASLEALVAADLTAGDEVTVTLNNDVIKEFYIYSSKRCGVVFDVQKDGKDIKIYFNSQTTIDDWEEGGKLSGTLTNVKWTTYSSAWQLAPANTWAWANLTYTEPKAVSTVVVSGAPTKTTYVDGEAFDPAGLTVTVNYNDATSEENPTGVTFNVTPATLTKGQTSVNVTATYNSISSAAYEVAGLTVNDIPTKTVAEFIEARGTRCYLEGIVSGLTEGNSMKYGNFDLTDASGTIYVYGCLNASGEKEKFAELDVKNGDKIKVIADEYKLYEGTKQEAIDVQYVSHISAATITIADITMEVGETKTIAATVVPAEAKVTYTIKENAANAISLSGNTITALAEGTATITATVAEGATYLGNSVDFTITITPQNIAVLPFTFDGGRDEIEATLGMSQDGLDSDYSSSPKLKFNTTEDYVLIHFNSEPGILSYDIKGNSYSGGTFTVQESENGETYTDIVAYTELSDKATKTHTLTATSRYVKFIYTDKVNGNVGLGNINITKLDDTSETPDQDQDPIPGYNPVANPTTLSGVFSVAADKKVQFSTGNLQYEVGTNTNTWSFASEQYEVIGGEAYTESNNTNYGMNVPGYTGKLDLFAWSCDGKYGVNPSNTDSDYQGTFVDWGTLAGEGWFTLTKEEMNYILNRTKNGKKLWALATIDDLPGLILLPDNWNTNITLNYGYIPTQFVYNENLFTADEWEILEVAGAVFLPAAGSRTGGYGNKDNAGFKESYDANGDYFHVDNVGIYGYYWLNTQDPRPNFKHCASYLILPGWDEGPTVDEAGEDDLSTHPQVWSREKRRGNSVRLVKIVEDNPTITVPGCWELVTDASTLAVGDKVVIAAKDYNYALSTTQKENNRGQAAITKDDNTISFSEDVQILTLQKGSSDNTFTLYTGTGYLYAASSSSNHLKTQDGPSIYANWTITINNNITNIIAQGDHTHNWIQYNKSSNLFSCYSSGQQAICLYRKKNVKVESNQKTTNDIPNYSDVTVGSTGQLNVEKPLIVENLYIQTTMGAATSAQISNATNTNLLINGDVFIDITLGKNGDPNQWHAFTVPFPVDAMNGVYDIDDNKLTNEVNYAIMDYHGDLRANGQYGWKKYRGILVPGTFYLMTVDGARTTYRFKKVEDAAIVAPATKAITAFTGSGNPDKDKGWNGVGNPTLMHGKVGYKALILNPASYTYEAYEAEEVAFTVGTPFFIQAAENGTMTIAAETSSSLAPARRAAAAVENIKVMLGNSDYTDRLYVSASEDAINEYEIGKDLGKMAMTNTPSVVQISALAYDTRLCMIDAPMANNEALVALNLYAPANGEYTLSVQAQDNEKVYLLHDGTFVWDLSMSEYPITLNKGDNAGYSILVHRADAPTSVETIDGTNNQTEKLIHNGNLYILHNGKVFDAVGTMLK